MLEQDILTQLKDIFKDLPRQVTFLLNGKKDDEATTQMREFLDDVCTTSPQLQVQETDVPEADRTAPEFSLAVDGEPLGITFRGIPNGHEFTSLLLAVLNVCGKGRNLPDEALRHRIEALQGPIHLRTFVSLTCTNCPEVVQALNVMAIYNKELSNTTIDGAVEQAMVEKLGIKSVPTVLDDKGNTIAVGRAGMAELLSSLEERYGSMSTTEFNVREHNYDVVVIGGGPAGAAAAIYLARKGLNTAVVGDRIGGQVKDTGDIENLISVPKTTGSKLAIDIRTHLDSYDIDVYDNRRIKETRLSGAVKTIITDTGEEFRAPQVIICTGASWRKLNIPGEAEHLGRGVAFCTHCDGPSYVGKDVAVIGGGNSGIEAAIDLAGICTHVDVFEYMDTLRADTVLQDKVRSLGNVDIHLSTAVTEVFGNDKEVTGLRVKDRLTDAVKDYAVSGIFVQIGLVPNTDVFSEEVTLEHGQIVVDRECRTNLNGVYAAGDCTDVPYKQIVIAMGQGATAALTAFDDRMRNKVAGL